jgi:hypothetical protein
MNYMLHVYGATNETHTEMGPITVAVRSKARTVVVRSKAGIVGSNPTQGMDVCERSFCVCVLCVINGLAVD